jgi:hypothetical protein
MNSKTENKSWLSEDLMFDTKHLFEPKYKRVLLDNEVIEIAENLSGFMETILKWKFRQKMQER